MNVVSIAPIEVWRLSEALTVAQTALLMIDVDPDGVQYVIHDPKHRPVRLEPVLTALAVAINNGTLRATDNGSGRLDENRGWQLPVVGDFEWPRRVMIVVADLKEWLQRRGFSCEFFPPNGPAVDGSALPPYLDPNHEHYTPKLAAAVRAWNAVSSNPSLLKRKSPKAAIRAWLKDHAGELGLKKGNGMANEQGIEEVAKVANWARRGGAPKM